MEKVKKYHINLIGYVVLFCLAGVLLVQLCRNTNQAARAFAIESEFVGEYSVDGGQFKTFNKDTKLSSLEGDLVLRGHFSNPFVCMSFYLEHIGVTILVDGEEVFWSGRATDKVPEMMCSSGWACWQNQEITPENEVEIRLHNPHKYGNVGAYNKFMDSLYFGPSEMLADEYKNETLPYKVVAVVMIVVSVALIGMAVGYRAYKFPFAGLIGSMGMVSFFMGGYILMDTIDFSFFSTLLVFNTCVRQYCIMFAGLDLVNCITHTVNQKRERSIANGAGLLLKLVIAALILLSIFNVVSIYDTNLYFAVVMGLVAMVLLVVSVMEYGHSKKENKGLLLSYGILLFTVMLEIINGVVNWWSSGIVIKVVFTVFFVFWVVIAVKNIAVNHQAAMKAKELEKDLKDSRIMLAMSQIQPHFIYNVLGVIRSLCAENSQTAVEAIDHFSGYLRGSLDTMEQNQKISFSKELELVDNYLFLEQKRFENKIKVVKEIEVSDFFLPPMSIQPLVENAVRHGIRKKRVGGTILIRTFEREKTYVIQVEDDGVGFDVLKGNEDGKVHVGLKNVEKRVQLMCKGSVKVESEEGVGTTITVEIPKK